MGWMLEIFLEMDEGARGLDEPFKKMVIVCIGVQPKLLENVVRFIIPLLVPALKKGAIKWMLCDLGLVWIAIFSSQLSHESRNPLAFAHRGLNLLAAQMMSKPTRSSFPEGRWHRIHPANCHGPDGSCHDR